MDPTFALIGIFLGGFVCGGFCCYLLAQMVLTKLNGDLQEIRRKFRLMKEHYEELLKLSK